MMTQQTEGRRCGRWLAGLTLGILSIGPVDTPARAQGPRAGDERTVQGTVRRFTTAPMGEVDGAVLDDGTVLHWPPHLADRFRAALERGDRVRAEGRKETGPEGDAHFEVARLTNDRTGASVLNDDSAPPPPADAPAVGRRERIRELQAQVDRLRREIDRLEGQSD